MKITAIKYQQKNAERVSVFVENKYAFSLSLDQLIAEKLKKSQELSDEDIARLKKISNEGKIRQRALEWVLGRPHSKREFTDYCRRKQIDTDLCTSMLDTFVQKCYINDNDFAVWFTENRMRKHKSSRAIVSELIVKGITPAQAARVVADLSHEDETLRALIQKLKSKPRYADEQKLLLHLSRKGFSLSAIKSALRND